MRKTRNTFLLFELKMTLTETVSCAVLKVFHTIIVILAGCLRREKPDDSRCHSFYFVNFASQASN